MRHHFREGRFVTALAYEGVEVPVTHYYDECLRRYGLHILK